MDLIRRQQAIDALMAAIDDVGILDGADIKVVFDNLPPAQPEQHEGHWIWVAGDLECSKCHTRYPDFYPDYDNSVACPHCGAHMKGERQK